MNNYVCNGNLTRDPEVVEFQSGTKITKFGVAVNGRVKKENGEVVKDEQGRAVREVVFWDCKIWGDAGNAIQQYSKKGDKLSLSGEVEEETWEDKTNGGMRSKKVLRVEKFEFLGGNRENQSGEDKNTTSAGKGRGRQKKTPVSTDTTDPVTDPNSIPF